MRRTDDVRRYPVGDSLFALALQMIALHEEGHYLNGHLETSLGFGTVGSHSERHELSSAVSDDNLLTSRPLELDADHFAAIMMLHPLFSVVSGENQRASKYVSEMKCELGRNPLGYMRFLASASTMLAMILWQVEGGSAGPPVNRRTHPTPLCRIVHCAHIVSRIVSVVAQTDNEAQIWNEAVNRDTSAIISLFGFKGFMDFRPEADTPWTQEWRQTRQRLMQLRPSISETTTHARKAVGIDPYKPFPSDFIESLTFE